MIYINIDRKKEQSITNQIYTAIKEDILCGKITGGEKMPSTREFSESIQVARNVIINCYEQLIAEGFLYTLKGAGTYVTKGLLLESEKLLTIQKSTMDVIPDRNYRFSFRTGIPDLSCIPLKKWAQLYHKIALDLDHRELDYQDARGNYELRNQLSAYLNRARGTISDPDHILITNGAAQSFNLLCQLVKDTQYALAENPMSYGLRHTLEVNNVKIIPLRTDEFGMITNELPMNPPKLIFTTPSHQFPTGGILPITRRIELINYAKKNNAYIVEDDYDSEFRFDGK